MNGTALDPGGSDMADIVTYLAFLSQGTPVGPPQPGARLQQWAAFTADTASGARLFATTCAQCHGPDGQGTAGAAPPGGAPPAHIRARKGRGGAPPAVIPPHTPFAPPGRGPHPAATCAPPPSHTHP